jgi:hypothetical protein
VALAPAMMWPEEVVLLMLSLIALAATVSGLIVLHHYGVLL